MANWQAALHYSITTGDTDGFRKWLAAGQKEGHSPDLINKFRGRRGESLLLLALEFDQIEMLSDLIALGADTMAADASGRTALHYALNMDRTAGIELLLPILDPSIADNNGNTPLMTCAHAAAVDRQPQLLENMRLLLSRYKDVDARNKQGKTALRLACEVGFRNAVDLLIAHGADVHQTVKEDGSSLLHGASETGQLATMQTLLDAGIEIDRRDLRGRSALRVAVEISSAPLQREAAALLVGAGADPELAAKDRKKPADFSKKSPGLAQVFAAGRAKSAIDSVLRTHFPRELMQ
jgi:hypothetical protein